MLKAIQTLNLFLKNEYETILVSTMEEAQKETVERYERSLLKKMEQDWEIRKAKILNEELKAPNLYSSSIKRTIHPESPLLITSSPSSSKLIRLESNNEEDKKIEDCWEALKFMLNELPKGENQNKKIREHHFVEGAKKFLEAQYCRVIQNQIQSHPTEAMVGGDPSFIKVVRAFLRIKLNRGQISKDLESVFDYPVWAQIYYCLRCGRRDEIKKLIHLIQENEKRNILGDFPDYFESYCAMDNQQTSHNQWNKLINLYKEISKSPRDPYQQAVYAIIGKCELSKTIPEVFTTTQDFMWLKLNMVKEVDSTNVFSAYNYPLARLQQLLTEYGSSHFSRNGRNPFLFFQVMLLSQQFERGIQYLFGIDELKNQAFRFAIYLYQHKLLSQHGEPQNDDENLDFVSIICNFVKTLEAKEALKYLVLIDNTKSSTGLPEVTSERDTAIKSVLLHASSFEEFFDACKTYLSEEETIKIFKSAAQDMGAEGRYEESFKLYRLAKDPRNELGVLNNYLARVLKQKGIESDPLMKEAIQIFQQFTQKVSNYADRQSQSTFYYLVQISEFFYFYHRGEFDSAIQSIDQLGLIPSHPDDYISNKVELFKLLDENVKRNFADILTAYMDCLYKRYLRLRGASAHPSKEPEIENTRLRARAVVTFSGFLPYKMPQDTKSNLMRTEVFMS
eukprot:TRINITY_DN1857_c1_g1_i2.p1 TRINITY_DN1857_c1_g1~~TRINITY_DN1857_c1_g1_i2.p1  ORF type:complete len:677 (+),score=163.44 TRINITY_DN1857_c1_g1_i2:364-2394(+)